MKLCLQILRVHYTLWKQILYVLARYLSQREQEILHIDLLEQKQLSASKWKVVFLLAMPKTDR